MTIAACAALVEKGDPDRFLATMAAPPGLRAHLFPLYAFNLEVARIPWLVHEPMIAGMRLQWWRDVIAEPARKAHEVAGPLHDTIRATGLDAGVLDSMVAARWHDIDGDPFPDEAALWSYLEETGAGLMWAAARVCGAPDGAAAAVRAAGRAAALASYLRAVPELAARGRRPLFAGADPAALARRGLDDLALARRDRGTLGPAGPSLLSVWMAGPTLRRAARDPGAVAAGRLAPSEFRRRAGLIWAAATGRW
jgi:phytoene synthase